MRKMTEQDQGCFMLISENVHPNLRLAFPSSSKILSGTVAWIVNKLAGAKTVSGNANNFFFVGQKSLVVSFQQLKLTHT